MGPYKVQEVRNPVVYELKLPKKLRMHPVFHVSQLKRYKDPSTVEGRVTVPPEPEVIEEHEEYEVEAIRDKRFHRRRTEYLIKWKGYGEHENTWIAAKDLQHAQDLVQEYEGALGQRSSQRGTL